MTPLLVPVRPNYMHFLHRLLNPFHLLGAMVVIMLISSMVVAFTR